jgi:ribosome maturation factor RimP
MRVTESVPGRGHAVGESVMRRRTEIEQQVEQLAAPIGVRMGLEIVDVELRGEGRHRKVCVFVDRAGGVDAEECARLSEALGRELDLYDVPAGPYTLEVSSPGLDRTLRRPQEFVRFAGRRVAVTTYAPVDGQRRFRGRLLGLADGRVAVRLEDGRQVRLDRDNVAQARLIVEMEDLREDLKRSEGTAPARAGGEPRGE